MAHKRLKGSIQNFRGNEKIPFDGDEIVLELDHDGVIRISREDVRGADGIALLCGIHRKDSTANGRFVVRPRNFHSLVISVEPAK